MNGELRLRLLTAIASNLFVIRQRRIGRREIANSFVAIHTIESLRAEEQAAKAQSNKNKHPGLKLSIPIQMICKSQDNSNDHHFWLDWYANWISTYQRMDISRKFYNRWKSTAFIFVIIPLAAIYFLLSMACEWLN